MTTTNNVRQSPEIVDYWTNRIKQDEVPPGMYTTQFVEALDDLSYVAKIVGGPHNGKFFMVNLGNIRRPKN